MPYIKQQDRDEIDPEITALAEKMSLQPGVANYVITKILTIRLRRCGLNYQSINDTIGIIDCVGKEFYRRVAVPYEETKITSNGDVY